MADPYPAEKPTPLIKDYVCNILPFSYAEILKRIFRRRETGFFINQIVTPAIRPEPSVIVFYDGIEIALITPMCVYSMIQITIYRWSMTMGFWSQRTNTRATMPTPTRCNGCAVTW